VSWWLWTLIWIALVAGALWVLFVVLRSLFRKAMALLRELEAAGERFGAVTAGLQELREVTASAEELGVFSDPARLRAQRAAGRAGGRRGGRRSSRG